jgi:hypothetical protein
VLVRHDFRQSPDPGDRNAGALQQRYCVIATELAEPILDLAAQLRDMGLLVAGRRVARIVQ